MWNHRSHVLHPITSFVTPLSSPQALHSQSSSSLSVFQSSCSASSSVVDSSGGIYCQFLFPPRVRMPPPLFLILPLVLTPLPCFFCFLFAAFLCSRSCFLFCLASSVCFFLKLFRRTLERGCHFLTGIILLQLEVIFVLADSFLV